MFRAHESVEVDFWGLFSGPGYRHWRMVERHSGDPWFHVVVKHIHGYETAMENDEGDRSEEIDGDENDEVYELLNISYRVLMPDHISMLIHILDVATENIVITDIQVVLPPLMTGLDRWTMQRLIELSIEKSPEGDTINVYTVEDGDVYRCYGGDSILNPLPSIEPRVIYRYPYGPWHQRP